MERMDKGRNSLAMIVSIKEDFFTFVNDFFLEEAIQKKLGLSLDS